MAGWLRAGKTATRLILMKRGLSTLRDSAALVCRNQSELKLNMPELSLNRSSSIDSDHGLFPRGEQEQTRVAALWYQSA